MTGLDLRRVEQVCVEVVSTVLARFRPRLLDAAFADVSVQRPNERHRDNFLSDIDLELHDHYLRALADRLEGFVYVSEEADPQVIGSQAGLMVLVDPLDTSELAVRGLAGYTQLLAYSLIDGRPLVGVVGDFFHDIDLFVGSDIGGEPRATLRTRDGAVRAMRCRPRGPGDRLLVTNYSMRPHERLVPLADQTRLLDFLAGNDQVGADDGPSGDRSRVGVDFGSVGFCHVAADMTDAFVEHAKGFAAWDLLPGRFILECAGGVTCDLTGARLPWPRLCSESLNSIRAGLAGRQRFIAASSEALAARIAATLDP